MLSRPISSIGGAAYDAIDIDFRDYSPNANGQKVSDAAITSGSAALTSASGLFVPADEGKYAVVTGAGVAGANLHTTIAAYVSATQVTLAASASTTVTGANFSWGTDDTAKFQAAIEDAREVGGAGGLRIIIPVNRYYCTGTLLLWRGAALSGGASGPYDPVTNPGKNMVAPTLMAVNESTTFITAGTSTKIEDLLFYYPNQVAPSASTPVVYPYTIYVPANNGGFMCRNTSLVNSYNGLQLYGGRHRIENLNLGALNIGILIDGCRDTDRLNDVHMYPLWDTVNGLGGGQTIDTWALNNSIGVIVRSADTVFIDGMLTFYKDVAIQLEDSTEFTSPFSNSYGVASNLNFDTCHYGIRAKSTNTTNYLDWEFSNIQIGAAGGAVTAVWLEAGGNGPPKITLMGGALWGTWTNASVVDAGSLKSYGVRGIADTESALLTVQESDGSPLVANVNTIKFTNGSVTDNGGGVVTIATGNDVDGGLIGESDTSGQTVDGGSL